MPIDYAKFERLKKFTDSVGPIYGTEDFSIYLYSLVKITKPRSVLELGTGFGSTALWIALGMEENNQGTLYTVDDGSEWGSLKHVHSTLTTYYREEYPDYINGLITTFGLKERIKFYNQKVDKLDFSSSYDMVFSDFSHGPFFIVKLLSEIIPSMEDNSYIFIDSASTYYPSYHTLESLVDFFNQGRIPRTVLELIPRDKIDIFYNKIRQSKFQLTHIIENKNRSQNSTAQIKISSIDIMPQPRTNIRF